MRGQPSSSECFRKVLGALGALESAGISEAAANEFVEDFDTMVKIFNKISNLLYSMSEKDDGRYYMVAVVSHVVNRALRAVVTI